MKKKVPIIISHEATNSFDTEIPIAIKNSAKYTLQFFIKLNFNNAKLILYFYNLCFSN